MKKWITGFVIIMAIGIASIGIYHNCYLPEFEIVSTIKSGCDNFTSVYLTVRINRWFYDSENMEHKVQSFYNELNGESEQLKVQMYRSIIGISRNLSI